MKSAAARRSGKTRDGQKPSQFKDSPRTGRSSSHPPQVALLLETSTEYGRGLLRGVLRYSRLHGPWFLHVAPGHLEQVLPDDTAAKLDGIIARVRSPEVERHIHSLRLPCVFSSLGEWRSRLALARAGEIRTNSASIARMVAAHLLETGFRRFAFCGFVGCHWSTSRERAFAEATRARRFECSVHRIALANWMQRPNWMRTWQHEQPAMVRWLKSLRKPVGLMACNDVCGREVLQACATAALKVPDEVAVVGVDNDEMMCELSNPPLSSVALDLELAGYDAALLLDSLIKDQVSAGEVWVRPTHVVSRRSSDAIAQEDPIVARALQFIRDRASQNLAVTEVYEEVGVSRRTLERRFMHAINRTVLSEIVRRRVERAKRLLLETDMPCYEIAAEAGFGSLNSFNRTFGRSEGMTAQTFRDLSRPAIAAAKPEPRRARGLRAEADAPSS